MKNLHLENTNPADALLYIAALLEKHTHWALDHIGGSGCDQHGHEDELDAIQEAVRDVALAAAQFGNPYRYSNGRIIKTSKQIVYGLTTEHVWHPDPSGAKSASWRSHLPSDPGVPSPGIYEVTTDPVAQDIHVRVVRTA